MTEATEQGADGLARARTLLLVLGGITLAAILFVLAGQALGGRSAASDPRPDLVRSLGLTDLCLEPSGGNSRAPGAAHRRGPG